MQPDGFEISPAHTIHSSVREIHTSSERIAAIPKRVAPLAVVRARGHVDTLVLGVARKVGRQRSYEFGGRADVLLVQDGRRGWRMQLRSGAGAGETTVIK